MAVDKKSLLGSYNQAEIRHIVDADTFDFLVRLGYYIMLEARIRLEDVSAPEKRTKAGKKAKRFVETVMPIGSNVYVYTESEPDETFGRYVGRIYLPEREVFLGDLLVSEGHARHGSFMG